ncbi:hypothetical protein [Tranquillimonas rosea]|uniref:hypothetical protein n=1 Tax=Tranquillimonas rosea TaxID=641238 RepID=UPI003BAD1ED8
MNHHDQNRSGPDAVLEAPAGPDRNPFGTKGETTLTKDTRPDRGWQSIGELAARAVQKAGGATE